MSRSLLWHAGVLLALVCGSPAPAQSPAGGPRLPTPWASVDAHLPPAALPWAEAVTPRLGEALVAQRASRRRAPGTVLMIVGGAVAGAGIITDESLLIVGGAVVAGYGLYLYLR